MGGENFTVTRAFACVHGSSPRGRGKHESERRRLLRLGLIPAWAGKTSPSRMRTQSSTAHPRVGGENDVESDVDFHDLGSSPRGRGKLVLVLVVLDVHRLIPAWAGKTKSLLSYPFLNTAHPRVGGENDGFVILAATQGGSSPRGRGKHALDCYVESYLGLIPAWAGKTSYLPTRR